MPLRTLLSLMVVALLAIPAFARQKARPMPGFPDAPGKETLVAKCFQCHGPTMWMMQRQDRKAWESTLYRMVGRGALWTQEDIEAMAGYLATVYGKSAP